MFFFGNFYNNSWKSEVLQAVPSGIIPPIPPAPRILSGIYYGISAGLLSKILQGDSRIQAESNEGSYELLMETLKEYWKKVTLGAFPTGSRRYLKISSW